MLGEWDTWRRSCAFSSADDLSFATATDAERKRLLESLLGLQRFDNALDRCRADLRQLASDAQAASLALTKLQVAKGSAEGNVAALEAIAGAAAPQQDLAGLRGRLRVLEEMLPDRQKAASAAADLHMCQETLVRDHANKDRQLAQAIQTMVSQRNCPTCDREWEDIADRDAKTSKLGEQLKAHRSTKPGLPDTTARNHAQQALQDCQTGVYKLRAEVQQAEVAQQRYHEAQQLVKDAKLALLDMEDQLDAQTAALALLTSSVRHLETAEAVLGTKGARAHMLHDALTGLEEVANTWLDKIARTDAPLRLQLSPYTEKKSGGTADSISLEVHGAGGGKGYKAASSGEQRRIDVALMLALAEVAQRADGRVAPTMFFDEVFDALDEPGRMAVVDVLDELAQDRCVVVMTHNAELIDQLVPDLRVHAADGKIEIK